MALKRALSPTHPGEILRADVLPAFNLSVMEAAAKLGVTRQTYIALWPVTIRDL